jgi:hypothetical protein
MGGTTTTIITASTAGTIGIDITETRGSRPQRAGRAAARRYTGGTGAAVLASGSRY